MSLCRLRRAAVGIGSVALSLGARAEPVVFRHVLDDSPLDVKAIRIPSGDQAGSRSIAYCPWKIFT